METMISLKTQQTKAWRLATLLFLLLTSCTALGGEAQLLELQQKLEMDVLELRHVVEQAYERRCDPTLLRRCHQSNYHSCDSAFPNAICPSGEAFQFDACLGEDGSCGTRWDYSVSTIRFPPSSFSYSSSSNRNKLDPAVIEDVCYSQEVDEYFIQKHEMDQAYWSQWEIDSPWFHFGGSSGAFRIYPARPQEDGCNEYDPRLRPWFVAGSSGPKNVVLVLDTSGSMEGLRLLYLKQAAARVVDTLTIGDRVALISFSTSAKDERIEGRSLVKVTASTKAILKDRIESLEAVGSTNIYDAFRRAFQVMEEAIPQELVVRCNTAVLFLTDGQMTDPPDMTEAMVLDFVEQGIANLEERLSQPVYLFTYSVAENDDVHYFPKQLACAATSNGVWSKLVDDRTIVESLASYTNLFSLGLGEGKNDDFTAWVEPYIFSTNGALGVTVSAPVFDRSVEPAMLIGVVGIDLPMSALDLALGVELGSSQTLERVVQASTAKCPRLEISTCQLEDFRALGLAEEDARCGLGTINCTTSGDQQRMVPRKEGQSTCNNQEDLPSDVLANRDYQYLSFEQRACCKVDPDASFQTSVFNDRSAVNDTCVPPQSLSAKKSVTSEPGFIGGMVALVVVVVLLGMGLVWWCRRRRPKKPLVEQTTDAEPTVVAAELVVMDPPVNPKAVVDTDC